jgi:hypothetical protein
MLGTEGIYQFQKFAHLGLGHSRSMLTQDDETAVDTRDDVLPLTSSRKNILPRPLGKMPTVPIDLPRYVSETGPEVPILRSRSLFFFIAALWTLHAISFYVPARIPSSSTRGR